MGSVQAVAAIVGRSHVPHARRKRSPFPKTGESLCDSEEARLLQSRNPASEILYYRTKHTHWEKDTEDRQDRHRGRKKKRFLTERGFGG
jgi:hypothetical protein